MGQHLELAVASLLTEIPNDSAGMIEVKAEPKCMTSRTIKHTRSTHHA